MSYARWQKQSPPKTSDVFLIWSRFLSANTVQVYDRVDINLTESQLLDVINHTR